MLDRPLCRRIKRANDTRRYSSETFVGRARSSSRCAIRARHGRGVRSSPTSFSSSTSYGNDVFRRNPRARGKRDAAADRKT